MVRLLTVLAFILVVVVHTSLAQTWVSMGLDSLRIGDQAITADLIYARGNLLYVGTNKGVYRSIDSGRNWQKLRVPSGLRDSVVNALAAVPTDPQILYSSIGEIGATYNKSSLYKSTDGGDSWKSVLDTTIVPSTLIVDVKLSPFNPEIVFAVNRAPAPGAGVFDGVFKSTNGGGSWEYVSSGFSSSSHGVEIHIGLDPTNTNRVFGTGDTQFDLYSYASTDTGSSWFARSPLFDLGAKQILVDNFDRKSIYVLIGNGRIHISRDEGSNWQTKSGLTFRTAYKLIQDERQYGKFFAATIDGVFLTTDSLNTWSNISTGLPISSHYDIVVDSITGLVYAGGRRGLYRFDPLTNIQEDPPALPFFLTLHQNYPNPFNYQTIIRFEIPKREHIRLEIFNSLGQEVAVLFEGYAEPGNYETRFDATGLPSGVYFYRLQSSRSVITKPMVLLK